MWLLEKLTGRKKMRHSHVDIIGARPILSGGR